MLNRMQPVLMIAIRLLIGLPNGFLAMLLPVRQKSTQLVGNRLMLRPGKDHSRTICGVQAPIAQMSRFDEMVRLNSTTRSTCDPLSIPVGGEDLPRSRGHIDGSPANPEHLCASDEHARAKGTSNYI